MIISIYLLLYSMYEKPCPIQEGHINDLPDVLKKNLGLHNYKYITFKIKLYHHTIKSYIVFQVPSVDS